MPDSHGHRTGVSGTLGAFNFIRRIGFPSTIELLSILVTIIVLSTIISLPASGSTLNDAIWVALTIIILPSVVGEMITSGIILRDTVLRIRRLLGLELLSWGLLLPMLPLSVLIGKSTDPARPVWLGGLLLVLALSLPTRFLTPVSLSSHSMPRKIIAALPAPILTGLSIVLQYPSQLLRVLAILIIVSVITAFIVARFVTRVDNEGTSKIGARPMNLFRGFLEHWLDHDPRNLEQQLVDLGTKDSIETTILGFFGRNGKKKGAVVVSSFHPGPYRDLGSSGLSSRLKVHLEKNVGGVVHVPHAISGHRSNMISSKDIERLLNLSITNYPSNPRTSVATMLVREKNGVASATGQLFDTSALLTLTMAPHEMEDIPVEIQSAVTSEASQRGLTAIIVDTHNSMLNQVLVTPEQAKQLEEAALASLEALSRNDQYGFKAGFAKDPLTEFTLEGGIAPGGVSVLAVSANNQLVAYVTIDGNNMQTGFREEILDSLATLGIVEGEVMTTDTHLVTGLVRSRLGYYPVGAYGDRGVLKQKILDTTKRAIDDLEDASVGVSSFKLEATVLGSDAFSTITSYITQVGRRVRNLFYILEPISALITLLILALV